MKQTENLTVTVIAKQSNGAGNMLLTLVSASVQPLPDFTPGAHIDVVIPGCGKGNTRCAQTGRMLSVTKSACAWIRTQRVDRAGCIKILRRVINC